MLLKQYLLKYCQPKVNPIVTAESGTIMAQTLDLGISDEDYLQLIAQGRDPIQELICERNLIRAGVSPEEAHQVAPLFKKPHCSPAEEMLVRQVWQRIRS